MSGRTPGKRPSLTRAETIESCNSEDLVTVLEVHDRKPFKIMDRNREIKKGVMAESLDELIERGKEKLNYPLEKQVYVVLEEDGTEVDEEEYFQTLPANTLLMLLHAGDKWSPYGPSFTSSSEPKDEPDHRRKQSSDTSELSTILGKLASDPTYITLLSGRQLELLAELDAPAEADKSSSKFGIKFLEDIQKTADQIILEKAQIRDKLSLMELYHRAVRHRRKSSSGTQTDPLPAAPDEPDSRAMDVSPLLERLESEPGYIVLMSGRELESLAGMPMDSSDRFDRDFIEQIRGAAKRHLAEKTQIRDALKLLKLYNQGATQSSGGSRIMEHRGSIDGGASPNKRRKD